MASFKHGVYGNILPTQQRITQLANADVPVFVGLAPVGRITGGAKNVNYPFVGLNPGSAKNYLGYDPNWKVWTLSEAYYVEYTLFNQFNKPTPIFINVFDPAKHFQAVGASQMAPVEGVITIPISTADVISDNGAEIYSFLRSRGIRTLLVMGVHANMCILNRNFAIKRMTSLGIRCILVRDLTDAMYNPEDAPHVSHDAGTQLVIEHIEKYVAPTITSADLTGRPPFRFQPDDRPRAVFLIGEDEYQTEKTLPEFARKELEPLGIRCTFAIADPETPHDFPGAEALNDADLLVLSVRRRAPAAKEMAMAQRLTQAHTANGVLDIQTRYFQDTLRELRGLN